MVAGSLLCGVGLPVLGGGPGRRAQAAKQSPSRQEYLLRYKFHAGDTLRWTVVHRCRIRTSVSASTQTAETTTTSVKVWRVHEVKPDGSVVFDHLVESVDMRHRLSGRDEVHYNSRTDPCASPRFRGRGPGGRRALGPGDDRRSGQGPAAEAELRQGRGGRAGRDHDPTARAGRGRRQSLVEPEQHRRSACRRQPAADPRHAELQAGEREDGRGHDLDVDADHDAHPGSGHRGPGLAIRDFRQRAFRHRRAARFSAARSTSTRASSVSAARPAAFATSAARRRSISPLPRKSP